MPSTLDTAIVLGTGATALGAMCDAYRAGCKVIHVTTKPGDIAVRSRYKHRGLLAGLDDETALLDTLGELGSTDQPPLLWPVNDDPVEFVSRHHDALSSQFFIPLPPWERLCRLVDKFQLYRHAHDIGVPAPRVLSVEARQQPVDNPLEFPCLIKPFQTPRFYAQFGCKMFVVHDVGEMDARLAEIRKHGIDVMISELVPGGEERLESVIAYRNQSGAVTAGISVWKLRQHPPGFGMGCVLRTASLDPRMLALSKQVLDSVDYHGMAQLEWKHDDRDGQPKLLDVNPRPMIFMRMLRASGISFFELMREDAAGVSKSRHDYRSDVYCIEAFADTYEFNRLRRQSGFSYREFFAPYFKRPVFVVPLFEDPGPWFGRLRGRIRGRRRTARAAAG